jgi:hypothetical protein
MKLMKAWTGHNGHADHCYFDHTVVAARYPALLAADIAVAALKGGRRAGVAEDRRIVSTRPTPCAREDPCRRRDDTWRDWCASQRTERLSRRGEHASRILGPPAKILAGPKSRSEELELRLGELSDARSDGGVRSDGRGFRAGFVERCAAAQTGRLFDAVLR